MGFSCSFNIKVKNITDIIGKDTIKGLTDAECSSTVTILSNMMGLSQEQVLDKKYKDTIINVLNTQRKLARQVREESTDTLSNNKKAESTKTTSKETKSKTKGKNTLKENLKSAQAERPVFDSLKIGEVQQKVLSISFPNVAERIAVTEFVSNYFSIILYAVVDDFKSSIVDSEEEYRESIGDEEYERLYNGMHQGSIAQQRLFCLGITPPGKISVPLQIFDRVKLVIDNFKNIEEDNLDALVYGYYLNKDNTIYTGSYLGKEFWYEAYQNGWDTPAKIEEMARKRVKALSTYCKINFNQRQYLMLL